MNLTPSPPDEYSDTWDVMADLRAPGSGWGDDANYDCRDALESDFPGIIFDPESSCFYAHSKSEEDAVRLCSSIAEWVKARREVKSASHDDGDFTEEWSGDHADD